MVARLARLGWLETIDTNLTPNFPANLAENYKARSFDPDTNLAAPWQSGMTGLGFDKKKTGDLDSLEILFTDQYKGQLTYLSEMRDTVGLAAIRLGSDPATLTQEQFDAALASVKEAVDAGIVRQVTGNSYVEDMAGGGAVLAMAWSGDVLACSSRTRRRTRTSSGRCPRKAGCSGPTTWSSRRARRTRRRRRPGSTSTTSPRTRP